MKRGILTSHSAGNSGPGPNTIPHLAPWFISVAATTIDRKFFTNLQLGNGQIFQVIIPLNCSTYFLKYLKTNTKDFPQHKQGISVNTFSPTQRDYPLIYGGDATAAGYNSSTSRYQHLPISLFIYLVKLFFCFF